MKAACVADFRTLARRRLPRVLFDYIDGGSYAETTLAANVADLQAVSLRQRVLKDVSTLSMTVDVLGQSLAMPVILAPVGLAGLYARRGETQAARAAQAAGLPFCLSTMGVCDVAEVAGAAQPPWFQLYMVRDRGFMRDVLAKVNKAACPVLVFTVDLPISGARYRDVRNGMVARTRRERFGQALDGLAHPSWLLDVWFGGRPHTLGSVSGAGGDLKRLPQFWSWIGRNFDPSLTWRDLDWIRAQWSGPIVIKGILDAEDAREAARCGADGLVVSNHGGRQLDGVPSSTAALPAIVDAVGGDLPVFLDGGVRSGLDVLRVMALGARACLIGRAWAWALAAGGERGVAAMLDILRQELRVAMTLTGCVDITKASRNLLA